MMFKKQHCQNMHQERSNLMCILEVVEDWVFMEGVEFPALGGGGGQGGRGGGQW